MALRHLFQTRFARSGGATAECPRLTLPPADAGRHPLALTTPAELRAWLADLPGANPVAACRRLASQLAILARYPDELPRLDRLTGLVEDWLAPYAAELDHLILEDRDGAEQLLFDELAPWIGQINHALAQLLKRRVNELIDSCGEPAGPAIAAAMRALATEIRLDLSGCHTASPQAWQDMLLLYRIAETWDPVQVGADHDDAAARDIHATFFATLLYQLADPLRLAPREAWLLFAHALEIAPALGFTSAPDCRDYVPIDMSGDRPPLTSARQGDLAGASPERRWLPLRPVLDAEGQTRGLTRLLDGLLPLAVGQPAARTRRHPRSPHAEPLVMYRGLYEIHQRLTEAPLDAPAPAPGRGIPCRQTNRSASGAAVIVRHERRRAALAGDFVLLESAQDEPATRYVARVRRLLRRGGDQLEIGVERLSGELVPVRIGEAANGVHGLLRLLPATGGRELYGPAERLAVGAFLELETPDGPLHVKVTGERERDARLACVEVSLLS